MAPLLYPDSTSSLCPAFQNSPSANCFPNRRQIHTVVFLKLPRKLKLPQKFRSQICGISGKAIPERGRREKFPFCKPPGLCCLRGNKTPPGPVAFAALFPPQGRSSGKDFWSPEPISDTARLSKLLENPVLSNRLKCRKPHGTVYKSPRAISRQDF